MSDIDTARIKKVFYNRLQEEKAGKRARKPYKILLVAAALVAVATATAFGKDIYSAIKSFIVGGNIHYFIVDESYKAPVPAELQGLMFDAAGNPLTEYSPYETFYTKDGEEGFIYQNKDGGMTIGNKEAYDARMEEIYITVYDLDEALGYFIGDIRIPSYLPAGFRFGFASFQDTYGTLYTEGNDSVRITCVNYETRKFLTCDVKNMGDAGAVGYYTMNDGSFDAEPIEMEINGHKTTVTGNRLHIEIDNIMYSFSASDGISVDELIQVAQSM